MVCAAYLSGFLVTFNKTFDPYILGSIEEASGIVSLIRFLLQSSFSWERALGQVFGYANALVLMMVCRFLFEKEENKRAFEIGLGLGVAFSFFFLIAQILDLHFIFSINRNVFFRYVGRFSASFSDPNAFGIMAYLSILYLLSRTANSKYLYLAIIATLMSLGVLWSGSRTYWLGMFLCLFLSLWFAMQRKGRNCIILGGVLGLCLILFLGQPTLNESISSNIKVPSLVRILNSIHWERAGNEVNSRVIFSKLAIGAWSSSPLLGIGVDRFFLVQEGVASELGIDLGNWRDNTNNYYLQTLTESGLVGLLLLLCGMLCFGFLLMFKRQSPTSYLNDKALLKEYLDVIVPKLLLFTLPVVLVVGPHLNFEEVRYFVFLLIAAHAEKKPSRLKPSIFLCMLFLLLFGLYLVGIGSRGRVDKGLYAVEADGTRWTAKQAQFSICPKVEKSQLKLRALRPSIQNKPLNIKVKFENKYTSQSKTQVVTLYDNQWYSLGIPNSLFADQKSDLVVDLEVESVWSPLANGASDLRGLGVQLQWGDLSCIGRSEVNVAPWAKDWLNVSRISAKEETKKLLD